MFRGNTFAIPCDKGGFTANPNIDLIDPQSMVSPTRNINLQDNWRVPRGGTAKLNGTAISGSPELSGLINAWYENGDNFIIAACNDGKIYKDYTTVLKTGMSTTNKFGMVMGENKLFITDGATKPQVSVGGAATNDITSVPTDWTGSNWPQYMLVHGREASQRMVALGCPSDIKSIYITPVNDMENFADATVTKINIDTGDGFGIVGAIDFGDRLLCFGKTKAFVLDDTSTTVANWGFAKAQWFGGVAHHRLLVLTPNDLVAMMEDGEIYSITAAQTYGDYKIASLTRPSFIHKWIKDNVNLQFIADFHAVYDPKIRAIRFFVRRNGQTQIDTNLVYFIDRDPKEAWMIHNNISAASGHGAAVSAPVRKSDLTRTVITGDYSGFVWELEKTAKNDDGNGYYSGFKTPILNFGNPRTEKLYRLFRAVLKATGDYNLNIRYWIDGTEQTAQTISLAGTGDTFPMTFPVTLGGHKLIDSAFEIDNTGKRIQFEIYNNIANRDFKISQLLIDFKNLGAKLN